MSAMRDERVGDWLAELASDRPAPGGGAAAAMSLAIGAALVSMVCNLTIGKPRYREHEALMIDVRDRADSLRTEAIGLAEADADAYESVIAAYRLPKATDAEQDTRREAIQDALIGAVETPMLVAELAGEVIELARQALPGANVNLISDLGVAASTARAALESAAMNVDVNIASIADPNAQGSLRAQIEAHLVATGEAAALVADVRKAIST
jgi:methenyltetrahydrofolate cyclohydrolase